MWPGRQHDLCNNTALLRDLATARANGNGLVFFLPFLPLTRTGKCFEGANSTLTSFTSLLVGDSAQSMNTYKRAGMRVSML